MYSYKLLQIHRCKIKVFRHTLTHIHVELVTESTLTAYTATQGALTHKISHIDNVHTWSYLKTAGAF